MKNNTDDIFLELFPVDDTLVNWLHVINNCALYALLFVQHFASMVNTLPFLSKTNLC